MALLDGHLDVALAESWKAYLPTHRIGSPGMSMIDQLHLAHIAGFIGGLVAAGSPPILAESLTRIELERVEREGHPS